MLSDNMQRNVQKQIESATKDLSKPNHDGNSSGKEQEETVKMRTFI